MRSLFVALLMLTFAYQHFACCCSGTSLFACESDQANDESHREVCSHHHSSCGHEHSHESSVPHDENAPRQHHFCVGSHVFYVSASNSNFDFAPQPSLVPVIFEVHDPEVWLIRYTDYRAHSLPKDAQSSRQLLTQICVCCV